MFLMMIFSVLSTILVIVIATPIFLVVILPLSVFYVLVQVRTIIMHGHIVVKNLQYLAIVVIRSASFHCI